MFDEPRNYKTEGRLQQSSEATENTTEPQKGIDWTSSPSRAARIKIAHSNSGITARRGVLGRRFAKAELMQDTNSNRRFDCTVQREFCIEVFVHCTKECTLYKGGNEPLSPEVGC